MHEHPFCCLYADASMFDSFWDKGVLVSSWFPRSQSHNDVVFSAQSAHISIRSARPDCGSVEEFEKDFHLFRRHENQILVLIILC